MRIQFSLKSETYPLCYRLMVVSVIKEAIRQMDEAYYTELYASNQQKPKPYTFAVHLTRFTMMEDEIQAEDFRVTLSSDDYKFMLLVMGGLQRIRSLSYQSYQLQVKSLHMQKEQTITSDAIVVKTLSPLLVEDENRKPLAPTDPHYEQHFNEVMNLIKVTSTGVPLQQPIRIQVLDSKRKVVKERNREYEQSTSFANKRYLFFTSYQGRFLLEGNHKDLQWLLDNGAGKRKSQGFGCLALECEVN
ncbi:CRISPR-associated endoribonuclease Cas6 [Paenibacillus sp. SC116]|uniref:CRISPR-associated endoribonuclease Cas6 n=1 Tax=Paenibacillus sp. SC116 TaxID=2968986 RepID=UPI00215B443B|nr:CRISPR-associated endoribonuclease Cas6 [Paenibacillus sp. SC116]MCR8844108.1 CRISPR-associated endoribonuclease Cas6 [Paenibacillus sp. SC116]